MGSFRKIGDEYVLVVEREGMREKFAVLRITVDHNVVGLRAAGSDEGYSFVPLRSLGTIDDDKRALLVRMMS